MRFYQSTFTSLAFLALFFSCSKKDHEVQPSANCRFVGKSYTAKQISYADTVNYTYESNLQYGTEGNLSKITVVQIAERGPSSAFPTKSSEDENYTFKYDADGFLTEIRRHSLTLQQGNYSYNDYPFYKKGNIEVNDITTFNYNNKLVQSSSNKTTTVVQGDNYAPKTYETELSKNYEYDSQGLVQSISQKSENGSESITYFKEGKKIFADTEYIKYDEKGRVIKNSYGNGQIVIEYVDDNITLVESHYQSKLVYSERRSFDNHKNPELLIPSSYKGIPDNIAVLRTTGDQNNMVKKTITYPDREPYIENTVWKYNANGLPETSTFTVDYPGNIVTQITKFKYENCN
ncbi:hypothetical protein [Dyadobacter sp. CY347]|uniref:hypothetical protein n=1 Tax=Dyadobacter sp. CY347 TaxID=2909336 RepID=UPI001F3C3800|nr:hypothetical protein [Dyadobacter sp. CY347]MCF2486707.1 hypothetical protein [Dyadobacter sp. CY347]